jgi:transcriptional regulator with XRE-family HTH domain
MTGQELKALRESLNLTQTQLADELGYSRQGTISDMENGRTSIPKRTEIAIKLLAKSRQ